MLISGFTAASSRMATAPRRLRSAPRFIAAARTTTLAALLALGAACGGDAVSAPDTRVASVAITPNARSLYVGTTATLQATAKTAAGTPVAGRPVSWTTSDGSVAIVTAAGTVQGIRAGTARITATVEEKSAHATITVSEVPVASVTVPDSIGLLPGGTQQLTAVARDAAGQPLPGRAITWTSLDPAVATVTATGLVTAVGEGRTQLIAASEGRQAAVRVFVAPTPIARIVLDVSTLDLERGETAMIGARVEDAQGNVLTGRQLWWASSDPNHVQVHSNGSVTALATATETITVQAEGKMAQATVRVTPAPGYDLLYERSDASGLSEIFRLTPGGGTAPLRLNAGNVSYDPSPSPDGSRFVFAVSQVDPGTGQRQHDLYVVNVNGTGIRWLTRAPGIEYQPAWSPDGTRIAFTGTEAGTADIYVINADGTGLRNLTASLGPQSHEGQPAWSPDARRIAFEVSPYGIGGAVWIMDADGGNAAAIPTAGAAFAPAWAPSGDRLVVVQFAAGSVDTDLAIVPLGGGATTRLSRPGSQHSPAWSPDGQHLAFAQSDASGRDELYTMRPDGSVVRLRTADPGWGGGRNPAWITR